MSEFTVDDVALLIPCEFCGAASGDWCVTRSAGVPAQWLHDARSKPIHAIRSEGWQAGREAGRHQGAAVLHRLLFAPVEGVDGTAISRSWLLGAFYKVRKELVP